ncbi:MAG: hypothetical protein LUC31_02695 [Coprobacillus sp.]|nr:hypothetical protein [Coprobacillus sp.]
MDEQVVEKKSFKERMSHVWHAVASVFATDLSDVAVLYRMQVREKVDFSYLKSAKKALGRGLVLLAEFAIVMAVTYGILWGCRYLGLFSPLGIIPTSVMNVVFIVLFLFSIISCMISLSRDLFKAKDNVVLETYPVKANDIYLSKLAVAVVKEVRRTIIFYVPIFFAYAVIAGLAVYAYFWILFWFIFFTLFEILLAGILALPVYYIIRFFNHFNWVKIVLAVVFVLALIFLVVWLASIIPSNINLIRTWSAVSEWLRAFLSWCTDNLYIFYAFTTFLVGKQQGASIIFFTNYSWSVPLIIIGCILVFFVINIIISKYLYLRITMRQNETTQKEHKVKNNVARSSFGAGVYYESKRILSYGGKLATMITVVIALPLMIILLNLIYAAMKTRLMGDYLIVCFNILVIVLFTTSSNVWVSSIYSKDANALVMARTFPTNYGQTLFPRLVLPALVTVLTVLPSTFIFTILQGIGGWDILWIILIELCVCLGHLLWSAEIDFTHPKPELYETSGNAASNPNEAKSIGLSFGLSAITMGLVLVFLLISSSYMYLRVLLFAAIFLIYRIVSFCLKGKALNKQEGGKE